MRTRQRARIQEIDAVAEHDVGHYPVSHYQQTSPASSACCLFEWCRKLGAQCGRGNVDDWRCGVRVRPAFAFDVALDSGMILFEVRADGFRTAGLLDGVQKDGDT